MMLMWIIEMKAIPEGDTGADEPGADEPEAELPEAQDETAAETGQEAAAQEHTTGKKSCYIRVHDCRKNMPHYFRLYCRASRLIFISGTLQLHCRFRYCHKMWSVVCLLSSSVT